MMRNDGKRDEVTTPAQLASWMSLHFTRSKLACAECEAVALEVFKVTYNAAIDDAKQLLATASDFQTAQKLERLKK